MGLIRKLIVLVLLVCMTWAGLTVWNGWKMYEEALEVMPLEEKVASVTTQQNFTSLQELPSLYVDAVLAVEDRNFYNHRGISLRSTARALVRNFQEGEVVEGGSTITQQLAKLWYFDLDKRYDRKVAELFMAFNIERHYKKDQILEFYFNSIYFGSGYYTVYDASMGYFGVSPAEMNAYQCTLLAGVPNAPSVYSPDVNPDLAEQRRQQVIHCMELYGYVEEGELQ
ncbi:MAG: transglycosylase domain-containing protein [Firmicutes bacterium]|nr:transglycosylase domain-containing protein [Bacillota bacterium]